MSSSFVNKLIFSLAVCLIVSGCGLTDWAHNSFLVGPNYQPPPVQVADDWIDRGDEHVLPLPPEHADWWCVFQDPVVNHLIQTAFEQNLTLRQSGARVMQARASREIAVGNLFPQVQQGFGSFTRVQQSQNTALPPPLRNFNEWDAGFNASWELDVWGKLRRGVESADARLEASVNDFDAVLVSLIAEVVTAYIEIRTFEQRLQYAHQNVDVQQSSLDLSTTRYEEGKTSQVGVFLAEANLNGTKATIYSLETGLRQANNRLCTLLGIPPTDLSQMIGKGDGIPEVPSSIAVGIPAELLRRRPDIREVERQMAAQSAQIGVAIAELYPSFSLSGEIFQASADIDDLLESGSTGGSFGPSFQWKILNYGRLVNNIALQDARFQELIANYQDTVLNANQEVEDSLVAFLKSQKEVEYLEATVEDLNNSLELLLINFEEGSIDFSPIFVLQGSLRSAQDQLAAAQGNVLLNMINVYRALGGGWQLRASGFVTEPVPTQPHVSVVQEKISEKPVRQLAASTEDGWKATPKASKPITKRNRENQ